MKTKRFPKIRFGRAFFGCLFGLIGLLSLTGVMVPVNDVYADPVEETVNVDEGNTERGDTEGAEDGENGAEDDELKAKSCEDGLGQLAWLICPTTGKISEAVDWLYDKIEEILVINPVESEDGSPIYEIWKYMRGVTNIVFIIFLLVVIYSQITGVGISNYGIKKALPKLIIAAVLVNLSFIICSLAVDLSNIIGNGLRGIFTSVEESTLATVNFSDANGISLNEIYVALAGGGAVAGVVAFETGAIWMLIPTVLGAIVSVVIGLVTIALRQAVVSLLIMIAPLAMVAYMLPNTEQWFKKWKQLMIQMLTFYPMFSLLFGASSLAGWAIIASAKNGFWLLLGVAVQIFPLFFSWNLMKMSGTFLGNINTRLHGLAARPLNTNRAWADSHRQLSKQKYLASDKAYTPSLRLMQFISNRRIAREEEMSEHGETVKARGASYAAMRNYKKNRKTGALKMSRDGEEAYEEQARRMEYQKVVEMHKNNFNEGLAKYYAGSAAQKARLEELDIKNVKASDSLKMEKARGERIEYRNAEGFLRRMDDAMNWHMDEKNGYKRDKNGKFKLDEDGQRVKREDYEFNFKDANDKVAKEAKERYEVASKIMHGNVDDAQYVGAYAAHAYDTQAKIITSKFQKYFELTPPTRNVRYRLEELSRNAVKAEDGTFDIKSVDNIDAVVSGLRVLNQRGDTDFVKDILDDILDEKYGGLKLGTHASQALASFLMFEVKDNDPYLRRFGKYINLETARMYDKNDRQKETVDYDEYIKGYHEEPDGSRMYAKKDMVKLMEGTSLDGIERTALDNYDKSLKKAYTDENGKLDLEAYEKKRKEVDTSTAPQFISANLKYLSGSEQIVSAVKSKTGFASKQNKQTGEYSMVPVWEDDADELFGSYSTIEDKNKAKNGLKKFYRDQTLQYLVAQTPAQILGLRSDYYVPLIEHLSEAYLYDDNGNEIAERRSERDAVENSIVEKYGSLESKEAKDALFAAKKKDAGEVFREILYKKGKLGQIEKSKRSGAANNAKDWVRELLLLDSDTGLRKWIFEREQQDGISEIEAPGGRLKTSGSMMDQEVIRQKMKEAKEGQKKQEQQEQIRKMLEELKEQQKREADSNLTPDQQILSAYNAEDVAGFTTNVENMWYEVREEFDESEQYDKYFEASYDFVVGILSKDSYVATEYKKYYEDNVGGDSYDLRVHLVELLKTLLED